MNARGRLVVFGILSVSPYAGVAWQVLHYLEGFRRLGLDVYYVDDTGSYPVDSSGNVTNDPIHLVNYMDRIMSWWGHPERWIYRSGVDGQVYSPTGQSLKELLASADILVNLTGSTILSDEHLQVPIRVYLETDPFKPQIEVALGVKGVTEFLQAHTHFFTFGENIGTPHSPIPTGQFKYHHTRQPVVIDWWSGSDHSLSRSGGARYTTITSWEQTTKDIEWNGERFLWSKHEELSKFVDLPLRSQHCFHAAIATENLRVISMMKDHGWTVSNAVTLTLYDIHKYRAFVQESRGEFTVAKDQYVRPNTGWFSDRSASYLAAGRPVITQETGFSRIVPSGSGLYGFRSVEDILLAVEEIERDYARACKSSMEIASEFFAAERVLGDLLDRI